MKIYHIGGKIIQANYDADDFKWVNTSNGAAVYQIDELDPNNRSICADIQRSVNKLDELGRGKYYIETGNLMEREGWVEYIPEVF